MELTTEKKTAANQTAEKLILVIEALAAQDAPVRLVDLAERLHMNAATVTRFLGALNNAGYLSQDADTGRYCLNLKICRIAEMVRGQFSLSAALHAYVAEAAGLFGESAHLAREEDDRIVYIDNVSGARQTLSIHQFIGSAAPMHATGIGKVLMSDYSMQEIDRVIAARGLPRVTEHTLTRRDALCRELEKIARDGYGFDDEECEIGVRCVAVPIRNYTGRVVAGMSVSGPTARMRGIDGGRIAALIDIARRASESLGYLPDRK